jgi:hypothetical protein
VRGSAAGAAGEGGEVEGEEKRRWGMTTMIVVLLLYSSFWPHAVPGTYQIVADGVGIVRMDTRTGLVEKCRVEGGRLVCEEIKEGAE